MPKLYTTREIEAVLLRLEFNLVGQRGSHGKFKNPSGRIVILPMNKKAIPVGTFKSILRQIGIDAKRFVELLDY